MRRPPPQYARWLRPRPRSALARPDTVLGDAMRTPAGCPAAAARPTGGSPAGSPARGRTCRRRPWASPRSGGPPAARSRPPRGICYDNSRWRRPFEAPTPIRSAAGCPPVVDAHNRCNGPRGDAVTGRLSGRAWAARDVAGGRGPVTRLEHGERPRRVRKRARRPAQGTAGSRRQAQRRSASSSPVPVTVRRSRRSSEESCARSPPGPTPRAPGRRAG